MLEMFILPNVILLKFKVNMRKDTSTTQTIHIVSFCLFSF